MLDYNRTRSFADMLNDVVDAALMNENATRPRREYLGGSRVGHACERALQFEFAGAPKDEGADFPGRTLRIFAIGHALEDLAIKWLRAAGIDLYTRKGNDPDGQQFGFSVAGGRIRGHADGIIAGAPEALKLGVPARHVAPQGVEAALYRLQRGIQPRGTALHGGELPVMAIPVGTQPVAAAGK